VIAVILGVETFVVRQLVRSGAENSTRSERRSGAGLDQRACGEEVLPRFTALPDLFESKMRWGGGRKTRHGRGAGSSSRGKQIEAPRAQLTCVLKLQRLLSIKKKIKTSQNGKNLRGKKTGNFKKYLILILLTKTKNTSSKTCRNQWNFPEISAFCHVYILDL
jgi:hypothetical protein